MTFRKKHYVFVPLIILSCIVFFGVGSDEVDAACIEKNGILESGEECDPIPVCSDEFLFLNSNDKEEQGAMCSKWDASHDYYTFNSGELTCKSDCTLSFSKCCLRDGAPCDDSHEFPDPRMSNQCCEDYRNLECIDGFCVEPNPDPECADSNDCCDACSGDNYCAYCKYDDTCACYSCPCSSSQHDCGCPETASTTTTTIPGPTTPGGCYSQCHNDNCFYPDCICSSGEGDCDAEEDCKSGLICCWNVGDHYGCDASDDICLSQDDCDDLKTTPTTTLPGTPECTESYDCCDVCFEEYGGDRPCAYCRSVGTCACDQCPCDVEYDCGCSGTTTTIPGTTTTTITAPIDCHGSTQLWDWGYCTPSCKCYAGEGDCGSDSDCHTGYCAMNVGTKYGQTSSMDVCENIDTTTTTIPTTTTTIKEREDKCDGCLVGEKCVNYGIRLKIENVPMYCDITNEFVKQKEEDASCQNNYECASNLCVNDTCIGQSLIQRIINLFKRLFGV